MIYLLICLLIYWFIVWRMFDVFYWKTTEVAAERLSSKCLQNPAKRERERTRKRGRRKRETEGCALHCPRYFRARANFTPLIFHECVFFNSPVLRLYSSIFQKEEYSYRIYSVVIKSLLWSMVDSFNTTDRKHFSRWNFIFFSKFIPVKGRTFRSKNARQQTDDG